jgi:hypothetical protein
MMPQFTIHIENYHGCNVRDMRRQLAKTLSKLKGDNRITFSFHARLEDYTPIVVYGELARPEND